MGHRFLSVSLLLVIGMFLFSGTSYSDPPSWAQALGSVQEQKRSGFLTVPTTGSIPFAGESTPSGCLIFTDPVSPPAGYEAGELYLYVDDLRGWELK